jgi:hypothetical protein
VVAATVAWTAGADTDMAAIGARLGPGAADVVTIGQALHWVKHPVLFGAARP